MHDETSIFKAKMIVPYLFGHNETFILNTYKNDHPI